MKRICVLLAAAAACGNGPDPVDESKVVVDTGAFRISWGHCTSIVREPNYLICYRNGVEQFRIRGTATR